MTNRSSGQLYVACRVTTLAAAVAQMTGFNITRPISCKVSLLRLSYDHFWGSRVHTVLLDMAGFCTSQFFSFSSETPSVGVALTPWQILANTSTTLALTLYALRR
jgi:hypothetical protein